MRYCIYCGYPNEDLNNYCKNCGAKIANNDYYKITPMEVNMNTDGTLLEMPLSRKRSFLGIALYFLCFYVLASLFQIIFPSIWLSITGYSPNVINPESDIYDDVVYVKLVNDLLTWSNAFAYIACAGSIIPVFFKYIKNDFIRFKNNLGFHFKWFGIGFAILYGGSIVANIIILILTLGKGGDSENQEVINDLMASSGLNCFIMAIITILLAPIIEELIFRKALFGLFKKDHFWIVIISALIFASIHVVPACLEILLLIPTKAATWLDLYNEFIYIFAYLGQAFALSLVYYKCKRNVIPGILLHLTNNLLAFILQLFMGMLLR